MDAYQINQMLNAPFVSKNLPQSELPSRANWRGRMLAALAAFGIIVVFIALQVVTSLLLVYGFDVPLMQAAFDGLWLTLALSLPFFVWWGGKRGWFLVPFGRKVGKIWAQGLVAYGVYALLSVCLLPDTAGEVEAMLSEIKARKTLSLLGIAVCAPIVEECFFRGLMLDKLRVHFALWAAVLISSALFALIHTQYGATGMLAVFLLALILAWARLKTGALWLPIFLHALNNGLTAVFYYWGIEFNIN